MPPDPRDTYDPSEPLDTGTPDLDDDEDYWDDDDELGSEAASDPADLEVPEFLKNDLHLDPLTRWIIENPDPTVVSPEQQAYLDSLQEVKDAEYRAWLRKQNAPWDDE